MREALARDVENPARLRWVVERWKFAPLPECALRDGPAFEGGRG